MPKPFVHLHLHTEYSLVDGTLRIDRLIKEAGAQGAPAIAVTDQANLFALVKFYTAAEKAGIKPVVGADVLLKAPDDPDHVTRLVLLCQDAKGYLNLCELLSQGYTEGQYHGVPYLRRDWVENHAEGLIALSGARDGDIGQALLAGHPNRARSLARGWANTFPGRFYIEVQRTGRDRESQYEAGALALAAEFQLPVVATNDVRFLEREDFQAHEARVCIHDGLMLSNRRRESRYSEEQYLKSPEEMAELFDDLPEAVENSYHLAMRCNLEMKFGTYYLPDFPTPVGMTISDLLRHDAEKGLAERFEVKPPTGERPESVYRDRLDHELAVIEQMGFPGYFLIVADFISWAKENDIPVGPGRGSGAGSLVSYALGITDLDPLEHDLLFERFLNPERISMPDFDVDFCMENRDRVIDYVAQKYGRDHVSQIITYGSMKAKAVVRDVGRVLGHSYGFVDSIAKLIPMTLGMTLEKALAEEPELQRRYDEEEDTRAVIDLAKSLEGIRRNAGKHAGGVVIGPSKLTDFTPLFCEPGGGSVVTQFDMKDVEKVGLVKFDFLGLRTLTIIDWALKAINRERETAGEAPILLEKLPLYDQATFKLLQACKTTAVFQLESRGMKQLIRKLVPDSFDEIVALVALFRPGPLDSGMVDSYVEVKHGRKEAQYPHPGIKHILKPTYGVILYQEQVMQIAQELAGYTLGAADILRRAMGKKDPAEMAKQRIVFVEGATANGVEEDLANLIFDQMETFAGYGFNKSHSAAYALIAYQTAWLKTHYPAHFMAAVLSSDMDSTDNVDEFVRDCRDLELEVLPPDVNHSVHAFKAVDDRTIRYGLGAVKGVGHAAIDSIEQERLENGPYRDLSDFCNRVDHRKVNRRAMDVLLRSGAYDGLDPDGNRARMLAELPEAIQAAEQYQRDLESGQVDLFGNFAETTAPHIEEHRNVPAWTRLQELQAEKAVLGLYLTGHPVETQAEELRRFTACTLGALEQQLPTGKQQQRRGTLMTLAGLVHDVRRRGNRGGYVALEDHTGRIEVSLFDDTWTLFSDLLIKDEIIVVEGLVAANSFSGGYQARAQKIMTLAQAKSRFARGVRIALRGPVDDLLTRLEYTFAPYRDGSDQVWLDYRNECARAQLELGPEWGVNACEELVAALGELDIVSDARLIY
ncbi:MAG: DNA polymerase III subunit alpha [Gammaproteobacteria bacterium]|nr:DNA polymerase III subunit alpha [Gammaproteobacteria bacterium]MBT8055329.1 DNA polymerase III subunit alpha [Gammaproteobacteria bacterium]NNJ79002.1 DNA polymerase III subunit alpha [Xanthomonadales bacterium]